MSVNWADSGLSGSIPLSLESGRSAYTPHSDLKAIDRDPYCHNRIALAHGRAAFPI